MYILKTQVLQQKVTVINTFFPLNFSDVSINVETFLACYMTQKVEVSSRLSIDSYAFVQVHV